MTSQVNIIERHEKAAEWRELWRDNHATKAINAMWEEDVRPHIELVDQPNARSTWFKVVKKWEGEDIKAEQQEAISDMTEEGFDDFMRQTKREALMLLRNSLDSFRGKKNLDERELMRIQQIFDSIWKLEIQRDDLLLKRQKARSEVALKAYDLFARYGNKPNPKLLAQMREALNAGSDEPDGSGDVAGVGTAQPSNAGVPPASSGTLTQGP